MMSGGVGRARRGWIAHILVVLICAMFVVTAIEGSRHQSFVDAAPIVFFLVATLVVGWLLSWKRPTNPLGWMLMAITGMFTAGGPVSLVGQAVSTTNPSIGGWLLWFGGAAGGDTWVWVPPVGLLLTQVPLRFPDGRLPSRGWRWFSGFTIVSVFAVSAVISMILVDVAPGVANPARVVGLAAQSWLVTAVFAALAVSFLGSVVSLVVRYQQAGDVERAQLRWVLWAVSICAVSLVCSWLIGGDQILLQSVVVIAYGFIPVAIAIAVLRYRLYEIDRIISRTAAYVIVSLLVVGVYALVVTSVTWLFPAAPAVAVALATLAAAALFLPALRWVRRRVDRRFNREQYNAQRIVEGFGERLRTGADPHEASADLTIAVQQSLEPTSIGLWVNGGRS